MSNFVICIHNDDNPASLIVGKIYRSLPDEEAAEYQLVRVLDEDISEPDGYLYPMHLFIPIELPVLAEQALTAAYA